ncbi:hypothetical protein ACHAL6_00410 [Proteiniclasticum sp. C24MP]|uniref:hypothetical protein n=1 Tax=Proteiniclasticum sp. C24MP TaxID=3374101 RepID=UPI0037544720
MSIDKNGHIDFKELHEGAEREAQAKEEARAEYRQKERERLEAKMKATSELMGKLSEAVLTEKKAKSEAKLKEETEKAQADIKDRINKEYNLEDEAEKNHYRNLLDGLMK